MRSVRDLARELGKEVRLDLDGGDVELDKTVIEAIGDPLAHLVRNALDHGIEDPHQRRTAGKPPVGNLRLRASQKASQVVIEVTDDGRGLDLDAIRDRAVARGLYSPEDARNLPDQTLRELLFEPGFSTAASVTEVSGRGVGLDVVRSNLAAIGGVVQISADPACGCTVRVTLPLTLAILSSLLVEVEGERFAVPQTHIEELVRVRAAEVSSRVQRVAGVEVIENRAELIPVVRLRDLLGIEKPTRVDPAQGGRLPERRRNLADRREQPSPGQAPPPERRQRADRRVGSSGSINLIVLSMGDVRYGLVVDRLLDSMEIVVKPLGRHLRTSQCYAGATVLGDGQAALILDVSGLGQRAGIAEKAGLAAAARVAEPAGEKGADEVLELLLLAGGGRDTFGVPLDMIERLQRVRRDELEVVGGRRVLRRDRDTLPVFSVDQAAPCEPLPQGMDPVHVAQFSLRGQSMGLLVAGLIDVVEVPAHIDTVVHRQPGIAGSVVHGDRVVLVLDLREIVRAVEPAWAASVDAAGENGDGDKVLVVEDSQFFLDHIAGMMEEAGYQVAKANDGAVALEMLERSPDRFDLVLTDIEMPRMDGFELVTRMREHPGLSQVPVIAVTSLMGPEARRRGQDAGIDEYSIKLDRDHLLERCRHYAEHGRSMT